MQARPLGVVGIGIARFQIAPVGLERAIDGDRRAVGAAVITARQLLRLILRLIERQHVLGVGILEIVGQGEGLGPVCAVAVAGLQHPRAVGLVAAVHAARCRARATGRCRACGGFSIEAVRCGFPVR